MADQREFSLTWFVTDLDWSYRIYCLDCKTIVRRPKEFPPCKNDLPYDGENEDLVFLPDEEGKPHVINVAEYFQNRDMFLEVLRSSFWSYIFRVLLSLSSRNFDVVIFKKYKEQMYGEGPVLLSLIKNQTVNILPQLRNELKKWVKVYRFR